MSEHVNNIYIKGSLIEAGFEPDKFESSVFYADLDTLDKIKGKKAVKTARRLGPIILHNIFSSSHDFNGLDDVIDRMESILLDSNAESWRLVFNDSVSKGVPVSQYIKSLPLPQKKRLMAEKNVWKKTADAVERVFVSWMLEHYDDISSSFSRNSDAINQNDYVVSLKKLSKFIPKVV